MNAEERFGLNRWQQFLSSRATYNLSIGWGLGIGIWRNRWDSRSVVWTVCVGPLTLHVRLWEATHEGD